MFVSKRFWGAFGFAVLIMGISLPVQAQAEPLSDLPSEQLSGQLSGQLSEQPSEQRSEGLSAVELMPIEPATSQAASESSYLAAEPSAVELAQGRRRTSGRAANSSFIGVGADFGYADDVSFAVISKIAIADQIALRPSVLIGDDFSVLVPVTYDFVRYSAEIGGFQLIPYAGVGASYADDDDGDDFNLLLSAGADIPLSRQFTFNAQANLGVLNDTDFGVTVGVGYNFGAF
ncbi:MAG: hypothetical protein HC800_04445 [Phormidesmis sp. RL_2_1]|nr:hypothetical protein [Phormidesmis sp. RL_2_1]